MEEPNIYFVGKAGAGKTKCSELLIEKFDYTPSKMALSVYSISEFYLGMKKKDRQLLQFLGTDVARDMIDENIWVSRFLEDTWIAKETAKKLYNKNLKFVSDDVRFPNEHKALKQEGWVGIYLDVSDEVRASRLKDRDGDACLDRLNHRSETSIDLFKDELVKVDVSGSLEQSFENLEQTLEYIRRKAYEN